MKAYKLTVLVIDHDGIGCDDIENALEDANFPNDCIMPNVVDIESRDIGEWYDEHPLNTDECETSFKDIFYDNLSTCQICSKENSAIFRKHPTINTRYYLCNACCDEIVLRNNL